MENEISNSQYHCLTHSERRAAKRKSAYCRIGWIMLCLFGIVLIVAFCATWRKDGDFRSFRRVQTISNAKQLHVAILDFAADYGHFPDDRSAQNTPALIDFRGCYSNEYLGQLIADGYLKGEEVFYAFDERYRRKKPDDVISPPEKILQKGECGFGYVMVEEKGKVRGLSSKDDGGLPLLVAPIVDASGVFEKKSLDGRGVYLRVDGSARNERLQGDTAKLKVGPRTLFDTGTGTVWGTELKPVILLPER